MQSLGIMASHGIQVDPGFQGNLQFCIFNAGGNDFELRGGMPIIGLEIVSLSATQSFDENGTRPFDATRDRSKMVSLFRTESCEYLICDEIRRFASAK